MAATYVPLATTTLASTASQIVLSSIPQTYTDLRVVAVLRGTTAATTMSYDFDTNNTADWGWQRWRSDGASITYASGANGSNCNPFVCPAANATANMFSLLTVDFFNYTDTSIYRGGIATSSQDQNGSGRTEALAFTQVGTTAMSSFILNASDSFAVGTTVTVYGIKAA